MVLSILIPSLKSRKDFFESLWRDLFVQIIDIAASDKVEVLSEVDDGRMSTGEKRNILLERAKGKYVVFVDDDDSVASNYVDLLLKAAESDADCFAINGTMTTNGANLKRWFIAKDNPYKAEIVNGEEVYLRYPNHITPIKREIAIQVKFPHVYRGEDYQWATELHLKKLIQSEFVIETPLYEYKFIENK